MNRSLIAGLALASLCLWHLGLRQYGLELPMISDEGEYAYQAGLIAEGGLPYRDAYNQKPPMVFFLYRLAYDVFGESPRAPRILAAVFCMATMLMLFVLCPPDWPLAARFIAPALYGTLSTEPIGDMGFAANTEVFMAAWTTLSALLLTRHLSRERSIFLLPFLSGLGMGTALATKQTAFWSLVAFAFLILFKAGSRIRTRLRGMGSFLAGSAVMPVVFLTYFAWRGAAGRYLEQTVWRNMDYASTMFTSEAMSMQFKWLVATVAPQYLIGEWPVYALALIGLGLSRLRLQATFENLITLWLGTSIVGAATGLFFFPHYFIQIYPPLALAAALGVKKISPKPRFAALWLAAAVALYPVAIHAKTYFVDPPQVTARELLYPNPLFESIPVADFIRDNSQPDDKIYIFGSEPQIYVYSGRKSATPHIFVFPLTLFPRYRIQIESELAAIESAGPKFIVYVNQAASTLVASSLGKDFRNGVLDILSRDYRWVGTVRPGLRGMSAAFWLDDSAAASIPDWTQEGSLFVFARR